MGQSFDSDIARRAFDAVAAAEKATSLTHLDEVVGRELKALGYEIVIGIRMGRRAGVRTVDMLFGNTDHPWVVHYGEQGHAEHCPITRRASAAPTFWTQLKAQPLAPRERLVFDELADFGLHDGYIVTVDRGQEGAFATSLAAKHAECEDPYQRAATHLLSTYFGLAGMKLWREAAGAPADAKTLSLRQIECLKWVRDGKSSADISEILGISARTVDEHVERACRRLAVKTRVQAVAEAALQGLLDL